MTGQAIMLGYQQRWNNDRSRVKVCEKAKRIGISWATAAEAVLDAAQVGGGDWWISAYNQAQSAEFLRDVKFWIGVFGADATVRSEMIKDEGKQVLVHVVRFNSGHRITALPSIPRVIRGKGRPGDVVVIDEAAFHDDPEEVLAAAISALIWGGRVIIISTHDDVDNAFNKLLQDIAAGKLSYSHHRITFDDAIADGLAARVARVTGKQWSPQWQSEWRAEIIEHYGDKADRELFCIPTGSGGTYLSRPMIERCMVDAPVFRLELPDSFTKQSEQARRDHADAWCKTHLTMPLRRLDRDLVCGWGMDFGRTSDLSVIAPMQMQQNLSRRSPFLIELRNVPYHQQEQILFHCVDGLPRVMAGKVDATGNGEYIAEQAVLRYGEDVVEAVHFSNRVYGEMMPPFKAAFEDQAIGVPRDADVLSDLRAFQVIDGVPKLPKYRAKSKHDRKPRHGDAGVGLLLGYAATRGEIRTIAYQPVKKHDMWGGRGAL